MKPSIGRIVVFNGSIKSNGSQEHPALVNRVWSDKEPSEAVVLCNLTVFPDMGATTTVGSVQIFDSKDAAHSEIAGGRNCCYWPDKV